MTTNFGDSCYFRAVFRSRLALITLEAKYAVQKNALMPQTHGIRLFDQTSYRRGYQGPFLGFLGKETCVFYQLAFKWAFEPSS